MMRQAPRACPRWSGVNCRPSLPGKLLAWLLVLIWIPAPLYGTSPSGPLNPAIAVTGPLQLTVRYSTPTTWNGDPGGYYIILSPEENGFWVYTATASPGLQSFVIDPQSATTFSKEAKYAGGGADELSNILKSGVRFDAWVQAFNQQGDVTVPPTAAQHPEHPFGIMVIGSVSGPRDVHLCEAIRDTNPGCSIRLQPLSLLVTWRKPSDTGAGANNQLEVSHYEIVVSEDLQWSSGVRSLNVSYAAAMVADDIGSVLVTDLIKGRSFFARVRGYNKVGAGIWGQQVATSRLVLGLPREPTIHFIGSGVRAAPFLTVFWTPPSDSGAGVESEHIVAMKFYQIEIGTLGDLSLSRFPSALDVYNLNTTLSGGLMNWTIYSGSTVPLSLGTTYFVRIKANNGIGVGNWSAVFSRTLVQKPNVPRGMKLQSVSPLTINITWEPPSDAGIGVGRPYPILHYQVVLQTTGSGPALLAATSQVKIVEGYQTSVLAASLQKGVQYFAFVRARNNGSEYPDEIESGYGPWGLASATCVDGMDRPEVCVGYGIVALELPTSPQNFRLKPVGDGILSASWKLPVDTGNGSSFFPLVRYEIELSSDAQFSDAGTFRTSGRVASYRTASGQYNVGRVIFSRVRAANDAGVSQWSQPSSATVLLFPSPPQNVNLTNGNLTILVTFDRPYETGGGVSQTYPFLGYSLEISTLSSCEHDEVRHRFLKVANASQLVRNNFTVRGLVKGCLYSFCVRAENDAGPSNCTNPLVAPFLELSSKPTNLTAKPGLALQMMLSWDIPMDTGDGQEKNGQLILGYKVQISNSSSFVGSALHSSQITDTFLTIEFLPRTLLYARVFPVTRAGLGLYAQASTVPIIPVLTPTSVTLSSLTTGEAAAATIQMVTTKELVQNERISVRFPPGFGVSGIQIGGYGLPSGIQSKIAIVSRSNSLCGTDCSPSLETISLQYTDATSLPAQSKLVFSLTQVINRRGSGPTGPFEFRILNAKGSFTIAEELNVSECVLMPGTLESLQIDLDDKRTGVTTAARVVFSVGNYNQWLPDDILVLDFPPSLAVSATASSNFFAGVPGSSLNLGSLNVLSVTGNQIKLVRAGGDSIPTATMIQFSVQNIKNSIFANSSGPIVTSLVTSKGQVIDTTMFPGIHFEPGNLSNASVSILEPTAYCVSDVKVCFKCSAVGIPADSRIEIAFPSLYFIDNASITSVVDIDGSFGLSAQKQVVSITRTGGRSDVLPHSLICFIIRNIRNYYAGQTPPFAISTLTPSGVIYEQALTVAGNMIHPARLNVQKLELSSYVAGTDVSVQFELSVAGALNFRGTEGGRIIVEFPSGFEISEGVQFDATVKAPALGSLQVVGMWTASMASPYAIKGYDLPEVQCVSKTGFVCGSAVAIELKNANEWLTGVQVTMTLNGIRTQPFAGESSAFRIYTLNSDNFLSDLNANMSVNLVPNSIRAISVRPNILLTSVVTELKFSFLTTNIAPEAFQIHVLFPAAFTLTESVSVKSPFSALLLSISHVARRNSGTEIMIKQEANGILNRGSNITFTVSGIKTRDTSGPTGGYQISIKTANGRTIDQDLDVEGGYLEYERSHPTALLPFQNLPPKSKEQVTVTGFGFGLFQSQGENRATRIGKTACDTTRWLSDSALTCLLSAGIVPGDIVVTIEQKLGTGSRIFSYDLPFGIDVSTSNFAVEGGSSILQGGNFGMWAFSQSVRVAVSSAESTCWYSDSSLFLKASRGFGTALNIVMSVGLLTGCRSDSVRYDSNSLSSTSPQNLAPGTQTLKLLGKNLGHVNLSPQIRIYGTQGTVSNWMSHTSLTCKVTSDLRLDVAQIAVTIAKMVCTLSSTITFDLPGIKSARLLSKDEGPTLIVARGQRTGRVEGSQFGRTDVSGVLKVGMTECLRTMWTSDTILSCVMNSFVDAKLLDVAFMADKARIEISNLFTTDGPVLSSVSESNSPSAVRAHKVFLFGQNFGAYSLSPVSRLGGSSCPSTTWISDTSILSTSASAVPSTPNTVLTASQIFGTATELFSYDVPILTNSGLYVNIPSTGGMHSTVYGINLGHIASTLKIRIGLTDCEEHRWFSDTSISCKASRGSETSEKTAVTVFHTHFDLGMSNVHSYDLPQLALPRTSNLPTISNHKSSATSITGSHLGTYSNSIVGRLGFSACSSTNWLSQSSVRCRFIDGVGSFHTMTLTTARIQVSRTFMFSYDSPFSLRVLGVNSPAAGVVKALEILNLGNHGYSSRHRTGQSASAASEWFSDSSLVCKVTAGHGQGLASVLTLASQPFTHKNMMTYDFPVISKIREPNSQASGGAVLTVSGSSFGVFSLSQEVRIGSSSCAMSNWDSDTALTVKIAAGLSGLGESVIVSVARERMTTKTKLCSYDVPVILDVTGQGTGFSENYVTLAGKGFGSADHTVQALINKYGCLQTGWISDTSVSCKLNSGVVAADVTLSAVRDALFCRKCVPGLELLVGCKAGVGGSAGLCAPCMGCPRGHQRDCEIGGTGECLKCKNELEFVDERTYKGTEGDGQTKCQPCTICGGSNQDGLRYEAQRCTIYTDTVCQDCPPCKSGIRIGCAGAFEGTCTRVPDGVPGISATATGFLDSRPLYGTKYLLQEPLTVRLTGENDGTSLSLGANTLIDFPGGEIGNLSLSAIIPSESMLEELKTMQSRRRSGWSRREIRSELYLKIFSKIIHIYPSGASVLPVANMSIKIDLKGMIDRRTLALYEWDQEDDKWKKRDESLAHAGDKVSLAIGNFSIYTIMGFTNETQSKEDAKGIPTQILLIILSSVVTVAVLVCLVICVLKRRERLKTLQALSKEQLYHQASPSVSPNKEKPFFVVLPPTPADTPKTPLTPGAASLFTPYDALGDSERTASWKRHLFARSPRTFMSPVPKLSLTSILPGSRGSTLESPNTRVPDLTGHATSVSEWRPSNPKILPQNQFSTRSRPSSRSSTPNRRDTERISELLPSKLDTIDQAHMTVKLPRLNDGAKSINLPRSESRAVHLPESRFRRTTSSSNQNQLNTLLVMTDDYGEEPGRSHAKREVRYSLPASNSPRSPPERAHSQTPNVFSPSRRHASDPSTVLSPRKIEFKDQTIDPMQMVSSANHASVHRAQMRDLRSLRRSPKMTSDSHSNSDDHSPLRHAGPREKQHESEYSSPPSYLEYTMSTKAPAPARAWNSGERTANSPTQQKGAATKEERASQRRLQYMQDQFKRRTESPGGAVSPSDSEQDSRPVSTHRSEQARSPQFSVRVGCEQHAEMVSNSPGPRQFVTSRATRTTSPPRSPENEPSPLLQRAPRTGERLRHLSFA